LERAFRMTSGPMPLGSPTVIAIQGLVLILGNKKELFNTHGLKNLHGV